MNLFSIFAFIAAGLVMFIGLIGKRSKYPWALFCWRLAALLSIGNGISGWVINDYDSDWMLRHHDQLMYLRNTMGSVTMGMIFTLFLVCRKFESVGKTSKS